MKVFYTISEYEAWRTGVNNTSIIGFVPTMGALHKGHISLIEKSKLECHFTVASIFVNPTQFDNPEDLANYPSTLNEDLEKLKMAGCNVAFCPAANEIYSGKVKAESFDFSPFDVSMEGAHRKGHFNGVGTVVSLLFNVIKPNKAYFGEKDFQQLKIIETLVKQKEYPIEIIPCEIVRETSGLAMSSRNLRLGEAQRTEAVFIFHSLKRAQQLALKNSVNEIKSEIIHGFEVNSNFKLEYFEIASEHDLQPTLDLSKDNLPRAFIAAEIGGIRLIDNMPLNR